MPALRTEVIADTPESETFQLVLDCWKAELYITQNPLSAPMFSMNGTPMFALLFPQTNGVDAAPIKLQFGGMMQRGRPVNLNQQLFFSIPSAFFALGARVSYVLTKTYLDPHLTDPMK